MKTTNHTPGPWNPSAGKIIASNAIAVCSMPNRDSTNANLIAAAPDLLSALEQAYNAIAWLIPGDNLTDEEEQELLDTIRAAISKAKGEA